MTGYPRHGHRPAGHCSRTYNSWRSMKKRCTSHPRYNGKGIAICERWVKFENFLEDMGERPEGTSLDRWPNPAGDYEPNNCRWATPHEQRINQRR